MIIHGKLVLVPLYHFSKNREYGSGGEVGGVQMEHRESPTAPYVTERRRGCKRKEVVKTTFTLVSGLNVSGV